MKSICIKVSNTKTIEYLLEKLNSFDLKDVYFSCKKFKIYHNIIIHYIGKNTAHFNKLLSNMLSNLILDLYEENIISALIKCEYFYLDNFEQKQIAENSYDDLYDEEECIYSRKKRIDILCKILNEYITFHHSIVLKGFITFRAKKYFEIILEQIDKSVNKFIVEKEYTEFISLLKMYVNSNETSTSLVHLVYHNNRPILLDENKKIIENNNNILNAKYLSDISFSSNDYALNTLLNIIPEHIYIHLVNSSCDEFINTLKLIFENRVTICTNCSICNLYKKSPAIF